MDVEQALRKLRDVGFDAETNKYRLIGGLEKSVYNDVTVYNKSFIIRKQDIGWVVIISDLNLFEPVDNLEAGVLLVITSFQESGLLS